MFHLSVQLELVSLECLLQLTEDVEVAEEGTQTVRRMLQHLTPHALYLGLDGVHYVRACVIGQLSVPDFRRCF